MSEPSDSALLAGGPGAIDRFDDFVVRHHDEVLAFLRRRVPEHDAGDLANETFRVALEKRRAYVDLRGTARPWLLGIANNLLRRHWRETQRNRRLAGRLRSPSPVTAAGLDVVEGNELSAAIRQAVDKLSLQQREVVELVLWDQRPYQEVADILGVPVGTVRSRLARARTKVRKLLESQGLIDSQTEGVRS